MQRTIRDKILDEVIEDLNQAADEATSEKARQDLIRKARQLLFEIQDREVH